MTNIQNALEATKRQTGLIEEAEQILKRTRVTKHELAEMLGLKGLFKARKARLIVAEIARTKAVISTSNALKGGYYIDTKDTDAGLVETYDCIMELTSRITKLFERLQPLELSLTTKARRRGLISTADIKRWVDENRVKLNDKT